MSASTGVRPGVATLQTRTAKGLEGFEAVFMSEMVREVFVPGSVIVTSGTNVVTVNYSVLDGGAAEPQLRFKHGDKGNAARMRKYLGTLLANESTLVAERADGTKVVWHSSL